MKTIILLLISTSCFSQIWYSEDRLMYEHETEDHITILKPNGEKVGYNICFKIEIKDVKTVPHAWRYQVPIETAEVFYLKRIFIVKRFNVLTQLMEYHTVKNNKRFISYLTPKMIHACN